MLQRSLENTGLSEELAAFLSEAANRCGVRSVVLFGSRARGDFSEKSDIDLAVSGGDFCLFCLDVQEEAPTLLGFDFVNFDEPLDAKLRESVELEGRVLYEKVR